MRQPTCVVESGALQKKKIPGSLSLNTMMIWALEGSRKRIEIEQTSIDQDEMRYKYYIYIVYSKIWKSLTWKMGLSVNTWRKGTQLSRSIKYNVWAVWIALVDLLLMIQKEYQRNTNWIHGIYTEYKRITNGIATWCDKLLARIFCLLLELLGTQVLPIPVSVMG